MRKKKNYWKESCLLLIGLILGCLYQKHFESLPIKETTFIDKDTIVKRDTIYIVKNTKPKKAIVPALNKENVLAEIKKQGLHHSNIVLAQSLHETGGYKSKVCKTYNNLFGIRKNDKYVYYEDWTKSITSYKKLIQSRYKDGEDYYNFLKRIKYAEDIEYINKLKKYT